MRGTWTFAVGAIGGVMMLGAGGVSAGVGWNFAQSKSPSTYTVSGEIVSPQGVAGSIAYECTTGAGQRLDIVLPAEPFNAQFLGDEDVGIVWHADKLALGASAFEQPTIDRSPAQGNSQVVLSLTSARAKILDSARLMSKAEQPVMIGLFALGRKAPVGQSDIVLNFQVPVDGAAASLGRAYALCGLSS